MPRNPKLMFQICQKVFGGLFMVSPPQCSLRPTCGRINRHSTPNAAQLPKVLEPGTIYRQAGFNYYPTVAFTFSYLILQLQGVAMIKSRRYRVFAFFVG